jgi:Flp pilus assembly protein TadD
MSLDDDDIPMAIPVTLPKASLARYEQASALLARACQSSNDANVHYMLAMAYKRQGKLSEARAALRKIQKPDANVLLQMALLSLKEDNLPQAEEELARAWAQGPPSYEVCYNLALCRLSQGKLPGCLELMPSAVQLAEERGDAVEARLLRSLHAVLMACQGKGGGPGADLSLTELGAREEQRLLGVARSLGQLDTALVMLRALSEARPNSVPVREAYVEAILVKGKSLMDRCQWTEAEVLLRPFVRNRSFGRASQAALLTLLGCCSAMTQDFDAAVTHFHAALKLTPNDARLHQNMAVTYELKGELSQADSHWNRFFDLYGERGLAPPDRPDYRRSLLFESLVRLSGKYAEKEKWSQALTYMQRASQMRPNDPEAHESLFHLYGNAKRPQDARRTLEKLRELRPDEPKYELFELDLVEVKGLNDIERLLTDIEKIRRRFPGNEQVEERAVSMVGNVVPLIGNLCDQLTDQLSKVIDQVRNLPNYQINWAAVREVMRDLMKEFQKLRRILGKCQPLVANEDQRRVVMDLADHIDKKIDACKSMGA